jgi:alpha-1,3-rhamnosyltransferase
MEPLVSVIVLTYNSAEFILETLESAKAQVHQNVELIITDDCSTDETVDLCRNWLAQNRRRFVRTELIISKNNTGIPANSNRGVAASMGEWVKLIAGDDILEPDMLLRQLRHINENKDICLLWTNIGTFYDTKEERVIRVPDGISDLRINQEGVTCQQQFQILLRSNPVFTGGLIIKKEVFKKTGLFDEAYPSFEDRPFLHRALLNGYKLYYLDIVGAYYRKHQDSVQISNPGLLRNKYRIDVYKYELTMIKHFGNTIEKSFRYLDAMYNIFYIKHISNKKNIINKFFLYGPSSIMSKITNVFNSRYSY